MKLKVIFYLKAGVNSQIPIIALISFGYSEFDVKKNSRVYKPLRYYTGLKIERKDWDELNKQPKQKSLQSELIQLEKSIKEIYSVLKHSSDEITPDSFKHALDVKIKGKRVQHVLRIRMVDFINDHLLQSAEFKQKTKDHYVTISKRIEELEKKIGKPIYANEVNEDIFKLFLSMMRERTIKNNADETNRFLKHNTVWGAKKDFVSVLNKIGRFYKIKVFNPGEELDKKDKINSVLEDKIYLDFEQIKAIIDYQPQTDKLKNTKLILLTLIFSGCRFSDVFKVKPQYTYSKNGISFKYAHFITQKGQKEVMIPILKPLLEAIEQNDGNTAMKLREAKFNLYVKELIKECKLEHQHTLSYTNAKGIKEFETKPFYDFVSSHTGRRSFITNLINYVPITMLTKITTHELKDKSIIFDYNKLSLLENAIQFIRHLKQIRKDYKEHFVFDLV